MAEIDLILNQLALIVNVPILIHICIIFSSILDLAEAFSVKKKKKKNNKKRLVEYTAKCNMFTVYSISDQVDKVI